jgi:hypothetical protein
MYNNLRKKLCAFHSTQNIYILIGPIDYTFTHRLYRVINRKICVICKKKKEKILEISTYALGNIFTKKMYFLVIEKVAHHVFATTKAFDVLDLQRFG